MRGDKVLGGSDGAKASLKDEDEFNLDDEEAFSSLYHLGVVLCGVVFGSFSLAPARSSLCALSLMVYEGGCKGDTDSSFGCARGDLLHFYSWFMSSFVDIFLELS